MRNTTIDQLIARIGRVHRDLVIDRGDIIEWTLEAIEDSGEYSHFEEMLGVHLPVHDCRVKLPVNAYRIIAVHINGCRCSDTDFTVKESCILVPANSGNVTVDLIGFKLNDELEPYIDDSIVKMCMNYCIIQLLTDPWMRNEIKADAFQYARQEYARAAHEARASFRNISNTELNRWNRMMRSAIPVRRR